MRTPDQNSVLNDPTRVALLDFDGTLADTIKAHEMARRQAMRELINPDRLSIFTDELQVSAQGHGSHPHEIIGWLLKAGNMYDETLLDRIVTRKKEVYEKMAQEGLPQVAGSVAFLGIALDYYEDVAIVTTAASNEVIPFLDRHGVSLPSKKIISGDRTLGDRTLYKPHPFLYQEALDTLKAIPDRSFAIEDTSRGIASARRAGIDSVVGLTTSYTKEELVVAGASETIESFTDFNP